MMLDRDLKKFRNYSIVIFTAFILLSSFTFQSAYSASVTFPTPTNLSNNGSSSSTPDIFASGNNVYVVWQDGTNIFFVNSADAGSSFNSSIDIGDASTSPAGTPKASVNGNNVFVLWRDGNNIKFNRSTDNGVSFLGASVQLSSSTNSLPSTDPQLASSSSNLVTVWRDDSTTDNILVARSGDDGANFDSTILVGTSDALFAAPQIETIGNTVYVVWQTNSNIKFAKGTVSGGTLSFNTPINVGSSSGALKKSSPQIAALGTKVYVIWHEGSDIKVERSTDSGDSFSGTPLDIGNTAGDNVDSTPQIATPSDGIVYAVWRDDSSGGGDIKFARSTDSAQSFSSPTAPSDGNLSNNAGLSTSPKIAVSGNNIFVAWRDLSSDASGDILIKASDDNGLTFPTGTGSNLSDTNSDTSQNPVVAASGINSYIAWQDTQPGNNDIFYLTTTISGTTVSFDASQYKLSSTATITVTDSSSAGAGTINASVKSDTTDPSTLSVTLTETSSGTFSGTITFTESGTSSGTTLRASAGDTITATFNSVDGTSSIFSRTIDFSGTTSFNLGSTGHVRVIDQNSNLNPSVQETVTVTITSSADTTGIQLTLTETGVNTGIFGGSSGATQSDLIFTESSGIVPVSTTSSITITQTDGGNTGGSNADPNNIDQITVDITSTSDSTGISVLLNETGINTAEFSGELFISQIASNDPSDTILVAAGDFITVTNQAGTPQSSQLLVTPADPDVGALQVTTPADLNIVATYKDASITVSLTDALAPGGGGGGLVRPGLVVNILAGASTLGGGSGPPGPTITLGAIALHNSASERISMPQEIRDMVINHNPQTPLEPIVDTYEDFDFPLSINGKGFALGGYENTLVTQAVESGEPTEFDIVFYTNSDIAHTSLYFNLGPTRTITGSDTQVLLYKDKPIEIIDKNGNIAHAIGSINNEGDLKRAVTFSITFSDDIQWSNSDLVIRAWNDERNSGDTIVYDAIKILPSEEEIAFEQSIPEPEVEQLQSTHIPIWIKNNAAWWSQELIEDSDFVAGIEYLIQNKIISIQDNQVMTDSNSQQIPIWIKNNAAWWSEDQITEKEFIDGLQWLISNGIIKVIET